MNFFHVFTKKNITLCSCLCICVVAITVRVKAQTNPPVLPGKSSTVIPPSPNAMAFQRYGAIPVDYYNGVAPVSVPLFDIKFKDISFPINLSYHGSGIKVDDEASKVGLGWVLNATGMISRSIIGGDDFIDGTSLKYHTSTEELVAGSINSPTTLQSCQVYLGGAWHNYTQYDSEPDQYYYNLPGGKSGKFILKRDKTQVVLSKEEKIEIKVLSVVDDLGSEWRIRTADGYTYEFLNNTYEYYEGNEINGGTARQHKTAWYLTKIISPKGNTMTFSYTPINSYVKSVGKYNQVNSVTTMGYFLSNNSYCGDCEAPLSVNELAPGRQYKTLQLDKITFDEGHVKFIYGTREDIENDQKIERIEMHRKTSSTASELLRAVDFEYGYFEGESSVYQTSVYGITKRLKLKRIYDKSRNNEQGFDYKFEYYNEDQNKTTLPSKASYARDHWGYYNGKDGNSSLIPTYSNLQTNSIARNMIGLMGDQRDPSTGDHAKLFALKKLWYPTGGYTEFEYEPHAYDTRISMQNDQSFFATSVEANGAETMFTYDGDTPGTYPASFAQAEASGNVLDIRNGVTGTGGNVVMGFNLFFLFNNFQSSCTYYGHTLTYDVVGENGTVYYSADIFNLLNESVNPAVCVAEGAYYKGISRDGSLGLPPGKYYFRVNIPSGENLFSIIRPVFRYALNTMAGTSREIGGGIRIKKISNYSTASATPEVTSFIYDSYTDINNDGVADIVSSYGRRAARPEYSYFDFQLVQKCTTVIVDGNQVQSCYEIKCETLKRDGNGLMSLSGTGSPVSYSQVVVLHGENGSNGKTEYYYNNESARILNYSDFASLNGPTSVPRKPPSVASFFDPKNGTLWQQIEYKSTGAGLYSPVRTVKNYYMNGRNPETAVIWGMEKRIFAHSDNFDCPALNFIYPVQHSGWVYLSSSQEIVYDQTDVTKWTSTEKTFQYKNDHYQLSKMDEVRSGKTLRYTFKYPADYTTDADAQINKMKDDFIHTTPVETRTTQIVSNVETVLNHDIQQFKKTINTNRVFPMGTSSLKLTQPLALTDVPAYVPSSGINLSKYKTNFVLDYNTAYEVCSIQKPNDVMISYLWGYQNAYPIAEVTNSKPTDAFYTSFENMAEGNSADNDSKTGKKSKTGGFTQILPLQSNGPEINPPDSHTLTTGEYILSYWQKVSGVWTFQTQNVTVSAGAYTISLTGQVDEVRFHPKNATMKTFIYEPMTGMVETIDENQNSTKFVYDAFNRLEIVKDNDGNLLTKYNYNYRTK